MDRIAMLAAEWKRAKTGAQEYIDAIPEAGIQFRPTPEVFRFAVQWLHVASAMYVFASAVSGLENPYDRSKGIDPAERQDLQQSKAAMRQFVLDSYDFMIRAVEGLDSGKLDEPVKFFKMEIPRSVLLAKAMEHHAHHRGQTAIYLRLQGQTPPSERLF